MIDRAELVERMTPRPSGKVLHTLEQLLTFADAILDRRPAGVLVQAGCYRGVSTARLSHLADMLGTTLYAFDSWQGLPPNVEPHDRSIFGRRIKGWFRPGRLSAPLEEARWTVGRYGVMSAVEFVPGWLADTLPTLDLPVAGAYLDVDLAASTRTCLDRLWPLLAERGVIVSQDGHLPLVVDEIRDWARRVHPKPVAVDGLGAQQMVSIWR